MTNTSILTLDSVTFALPDGRQLFSDLNLDLDLRRTGLVGRNGVGKSVLARILAGHLTPSAGRCLRHGRVHYLEQQATTASATLAELARVDQVIAALARIEAGSCDPADFDTVGERWDVRERLQAWLERHGLPAVDLERPAASLSGGQAMAVALAGAWASDADYLILDEPSNHLDSTARRQLLDMLEQWPRGVLVISHDRALLEHMQRIVELTPRALHSHGGNYSLYARHTAKAREAAGAQLARLKQQRRQQAQAQQQQRENLERHQARATRQARGANQAPILLDRQQQRSQATAGKQRREQQVAQRALDSQVREAALRLETDDPVMLHAPVTRRPAGHEVLCLEGLRLPHGTRRPLDLRLRQGERLGLVGGNGSGKSTLLQVLTGQQQACAGTVRTHGELALLDQHCSLLPADLSVLALLRQSNPAQATGALRTRLAQLGLDAARVELPCALLSGGERLKAALAALLYRERAVDLLLLDEPNNHLDLPSLAALEQMLRQFPGALLVASHDPVFLDQLQLEGHLRLD
ncbi:MAG: ATP-binding cassette domain-containing protein [Paucimonas sp.]|nr:ATP-binding cassette domain-containing protein [Paucimonas sp.]